ncbi:11566_t:CDS:2 [Ambispora gerdemannii]|uniref:11566_t:CDS:1 n=1 Tax=Ambispora gerdemannii TaxID=144530 RepID=A0A9N9C5S1_9GLOM|nr:11566_t:CDS:2 [Ambispora gerdemannii]
MTTAARPTFDPARGRDSKAPTLQYSSRDLAAHTKLKYRQTGQLTQEELDRVDLKQELLKAEHEHFEKARKEGGIGASASAVDKSVGSIEERKQRLLIEAADEDDEDDTEELLRELEKIKKERAEEKERQERENTELQEQKRQEEIATGNPLLHKDFSVKRRWDDDVIFKNQARGVDDKPKKRFINDTLRSDFHRNIGSALTDSLDELIMQDKITPQLAMKVLVQFDKSITEALEKGKGRGTFKGGRLHTYRFCDEVWTFIIERPNFRLDNDNIPADKIKIVACNAKKPGDADNK